MKATLLLATIVAGCLDAPAPGLTSDDEDLTAVPLAEYTVNGHILNPTERKWVRYIGRTVVNQLHGSLSARLTLAAQSTWWTLKEGVLDLANPYKFSSCNFDGYDEWIGPNEECPDPTHAWQVGIAAVQVPNYSYATVKGVANQLFPHNSTSDVIGFAAELAGYPEGSAEWNTLVGSEGRLRTSWLLRSPPVGLTLVDTEVVGECVDASYGWCYGTGWDTTALYAPTRTAAMRSISDLRVLLEKFQH
ncbi:MAG: hypothetical protein ABI678_02930 [Kofleriaceae bacterium]